MTDSRDVHQTDDRSRENSERAGQVYDNYEIQGCREHGAGAGRYVEPCHDSEAQFWTLYGHINGQGVEAIGDFHSREAAEEVHYRITGLPYSGANVSERLRLMHSAPDLLEALEPYAVAARSRINTTAAAGDDWESLEHAF